MDLETIDRSLDTNVTRRTVVKTGVKLAYAAPLVAASFKLAGDAAAAVSPTCTPGTCSAPVRCGFRCRCRQVGGAALCLQNIGCPGAQVCGPGHPACGAGSVCLVDSCCGYPVCVPVCGTAQSLDATTESVDGPWALGAPDPDEL